MVKGDAHTFIISVSPSLAPGPSPRARCARRGCGGEGDAAPLSGAARLLPGETPPAAGSSPPGASGFADSDKPAAKGTCSEGGEAPSARASDDEASSSVSRARAIARNALRRSRMPHAAETLGKLMRSSSIVSCNPTCRRRGARRRLRDRRACRSSTIVLL